MIQKRICFLLIVMAIAGHLSAKETPTDKLERPRLVLGLVIDQMRWDYLYRYYDRYSANGFKRLMREGYNCQNTAINYIPSYTAPGHACIYTGSVPSIHGIASNDWIDNTTGTNCYCVEDTSVFQSDNAAIRSMSPRNLQVTTITDELKLATNFKSKVFGIAIKDRSCILPAGHLANGAFWYNEFTGKFSTSTYYTAPPAWVDAFNNRNIADSLTKQNWDLLYGANTYTQSTADNNAYEMPFRNEAAPVFSHNFNTLPVTDRYKIIKNLPAGNTMTLEMAKACMSGEHLGQGEATDFLCISLSSTDYIGHQFGPNSVEIEDTYLRLDLELANFLDFLDKTVGKGNYLLFVSADHGAAHNATFLRDNHIPAGYPTTDIARTLNTYLKASLGKDSLVRGFVNYQVYLNEPLVVASGIKRTDLKAAICEWFRKDTAVAYAMDMEDAKGILVPDPVLSMAINGYYRQRSGPIQIIYRSGWYEAGPKGTTHGTWNPYDTHIPLLWYGWHINKGETQDVVHMTDIAATIAALLHIQMPSGCIGKPINNLFVK